MSKAQDRATVRTTLQQYWQASKRHKRELSLSLLLPFSSILLSVAMPYFASRVLAALVTNGPGIWTDFWLFVGAGIAGIALNSIGIRNALILQAKTMAELYERVYWHLMQRSVGFYNNQIGGKLVSDALDYVSSYGQLANAGYISGVSFLAATIVGLIVICVNNLLLGLMVAALLTGVFWWTVIESRRRKAIRLERLKITKESTSHLSDSLVNAVTVKTFAKEAAEFKHSQEITKRLTSARMRDWQRTVINENHRMAVLLAAQVFLVLGLIILTRNDPSLLAAGIFAFTYTIGLISRFYSLNIMVRQLDDSLLLAMPMTEILETSAEIVDAPEASELKVEKGRIELRDVTFRYADAAPGDTVFSKLNLQIQPGEKIGLVGHSGGGKTTLTRLLLRFDDISGGAITIDGQNIAEVTQTSLREQIAYVPQEPLLFHRSIRENIAYSHPHSTSAAIKAAAEKAYANDFIESLPSGYETVVGERGVKLSGGQRQRVAIARAILKNAPILVLDEATSALDSESEKAIQAALWELMKGKTALVIAHRLSTIQRMDRIIVMDGGKIVEQGTHAELLKQKGKYAKLWAHQSGGFIEE
ncbi:ABC transporter ATP-binding protein [soil metagenome]